MYGPLVVALGVLFLGVYLRVPVLREWNNYIRQYERKPQILPPRCPTPHSGDSEIHGLRNFVGFHIGTIDWALGIGGAETNLGYQFVYGTVTFSMFFY